MKIKLLTKNRFVVSGKRFLLFLLMIFAVNVWGQTYSLDLSDQNSAFGTNNSYGNKSGTVGGVQWYINSGSSQSASNVWLGANNAANRTSFCILSAGVNSRGAAIASALSSYTGTTITTSTVGYYAIVGANAITNVASIKVAASATGGTAPETLWCLYTTDGGSTYTVLGSKTNPGTTEQTFTPSSTISTAQYAFVLYSSASGTYRTPYFKFYAPVSPTLTATTVTGASLNTTYGTASNGVQTSANGSALTGNITVTAATGFEVSKTSASAGFANTLTIAAGSNNIWVRTAATKAAGNSGTGYAAGTVVATLSGGGASANANITTATSVITVSKKALTLTVNPRTITYGETVANVTAAANNSYVLSGFANSETSASGLTGTPTYTTTYAGNENAGAAGETVSYNNGLSSTNYTFSNVSASITIQRANTTSITVTNGSPYTYIPGTPQGPSAVTVVPAASNGAVTYSYSGTENNGNTYASSSTRPTNAGSYSVIATVAQSTNYKSLSSSATPFTINKANSTVEVTGATSYAYNGSEHGPTTYDHTGSAGAVTLHYTGISGTSYAESTTRPTAVGSYKAVATLAADDNYNGAVSDDFNFQITSVAVPEITSPSAWSTTYGVAATAYTLTASNNPTSFGVSGLPTGLSYNSTTHEITGTPTVAPGDYEVTLSAANDGGTGDAVTLVITVAKKNVSIVDTSVSDKIYDGNNTATLSGTANGFVGGDDVALALAAHFDDANVGEGKTVTSTSTLTGSKASYYNLIQPTGLTGNITKATPAVVVTGSTSFIYNGSAQGPATSTVTPSAAGTATYSYSGTESGGTIYGPSATRPTNAGSYSVVAMVAESANYNAASSTAYAFTIAKADQALTGFGSNITKLSTDAPFTLPAAITTTGGQTVVYTVTDNPNAGVATISGNTVTIKGVGTTGITAHADATANYNAFDASINLTVNFDASSVPVAIAATNILGTGFNANWNALLNADSYKLDVYTKTTAAADTELFDHSGTSVPSGWSATNIGQPGSYLKMIMSTSVLTTSTIDLSNYATAELNMTLGTFGGTGNGNAVTFDFSTDNGSTWSPSITRQGTSTSSAMSPIDLSSYAGYSLVKIRMRTLSATGSSANGTSGQGARLYNMVLTGKQKVKSSISGSPFNIPAQDPQPSTYTRVFNDLNRNTQYYYVVRASNNSTETGNSNEIAVKTTNAVVWDGSSWSNSGDGPDETMDAEISGNYTIANSFEAKNLTVTSAGSLTIQADKDVVVHGDIILPADNKIIVESDANLVQKANGADTNPTNYSITVKRNSKLPAAGYTFWSSPVVGQNLYGFSNGYNPAGTAGTGTPWNRFYVYNEANDYFVTKITGEIELTSASVFNAGRGYAIKGMNSFGNNAINEFEFTGKMNNGQILSQALKNSCTVEAGCEKGYNLVGNPYPSNIDFVELYNANSSKIYGTAYFWTNNDITVTQQVGNDYSGNNYAIYNLSGGTGAVDPDPNQGNGSEVPNGIIKVGQGFIVKAKVAGKGQSLEFNNNIRLGYDAQAIFYNSKKADKNRFWLTLTSPANVANTILMAYMPEATNDFEVNYDGELFVIGSDSFYSVLGSRKLAIQGKADFNVEDKVALGNVYSKDGEYKISIKTKEGIFNGTQDVYLKDKVLNKVVNLSQGDYVFQGVKGTDDTRFEIVYKSDVVLATDAAGRSDFSVYKDGNSYVITSSKKLGKVEVYDTAGRLMRTLSTNETSVKIDASAFSNGVYVLKVENSGDVKTRKVIK